MSPVATCLSPTRPSSGTCQLEKITTHVRTHASILPRCYITSSCLRNVRSHLPHATLMYGVHVVFLVSGFLSQARAPPSRYYHVRRSRCVSCACFFFSQACVPYMFSSLMYFNSPFRQYFYLFPSLCSISSLILLLVHPILTSFSFPCSSKYHSKDFIIIENVKVCNWIIE
jgi:hypothetical protein